MRDGPLGPRADLWRRRGSRTLWRHPVRLAMRLLLSAALALSLVGCRDYIVEPAPPPAPAPTQDNPEPDLPVTSLKGPQEVELGDPVTYRAGFVDEGLTYEFVFDGPILLDQTDRDSDRYFHGIALAPGRSTLRVFLIDADGERVAHGQREFEVDGEERPDR